MRLIAFVTEIGSITCILGYLGEPTKAPHVAPAARGPPDWEGALIRAKATRSLGVSPYPSISSTSG